MVELKETTRIRRYTASHHVPVKCLLVLPNSLYEAHPSGLFLKTTIIALYKFKVCGLGQVAGTCGCGEGLSGSINAGNFLTSCKVYWLTFQERLCSME